ncbi:dynamin family protein [Mesobacillus campisalis]|nr:dynamin family protein [Mesobacillus campisalis]
MMGQLVAQKEKQLLDKILKLHPLFLENDDLEAAEKSKEIGKKLLEKEFAIGFCGHFSAGKSSMINKLVGEDILPSSPIPTSANLVKIKGGEEYARVYFKKGKPRLYPAPYDYETVKNYCKDGDQIQSLEISHKGSGFLEAVTVMDTPGIDSTDDAHRIATESALHLADLVLYVMDYNHVQSELNFLFTKELTDAGKELYLVVNMIDKHREEELSFKQFQESVSASFSAWGVKPKGIFYTSLRNPDMNHNQFEQLQTFLEQYIEQRDELLPQSAAKSLVKISEDHIHSLSLQAEEKLEALETMLKEVPQHEWAEIEEKQASAALKLEHLNRQQELAATEFNSKLEGILKNAYLMPFQTRELAESYLKAMQPDFKAGLFFAKQKTMQERADRLERFYQDLSEKVQAQIDWHVKEFLLGLLKEKGISDSGLLSLAQGFKTDFRKEILGETIKTGAVVSGDYVLNYTNDVAEALKKTVRTQLNSFRESYAAAVREQASIEMSAAKEEEAHWGMLANAYKEWCAVKEWLAHSSERIFDILYGKDTTEPSEEKALSFFDTEMDEEVWEGTENKQTPEAVQVPEETYGMASGTVQETTAEDSQHQLEKLVGKLRRTARELKDIPGLKRSAKELGEKAERLENQQFTVALFGAFSAGKSSFANALIGEGLLPVSPNPTTAAINKIKPPSKEHPHGTVIVKVKGSRELLEEVNRSLSLFGYGADDLAAAGTKIKSIQEIDTSVGTERLHYSFLKAFAKGLSHFEGKFNEQFESNLESFRSYVADEEKSCFVEWIEVYYDCELTRQGITLVDTPGADSINARHTGVAFDYIKNSDAILFVTYYNHAFSKADREFLIQLGRVKDSFELDKMFFIVNAIDLANSEDEMLSVIQYVEEQLVQYGIRKPHMFPVSSLEALKVKTGGNGGENRFKAFEHAFYSFIDHDLRKMAMDSAEGKWLQSVELLRKMIQSAEEGMEEKTRKLAALENEKMRVSELLGAKNTSFLQSQLHQEIDELVYYINQRVFFRFGEFFRESFNPALLRDDGRNLKKALQTALDDLLSHIGYDLLQEVRASSLRVEAHLARLIDGFQKDLAQELAKMNPNLSFAAWEISRFPEIDFEGPFKDLDRGQFKKALGLFRNPKAFFEKNEKARMGEELEQLLHSPADIYLESQNKVLKNHYYSALEQLFTSLINDYSEQAEEYFVGVQSALAVDFPVEQLKETLNAIRHT